IVSVILTRFGSTIFCSCSESRLNYRRHRARLRPRHERLPCREKQDQGRRDRGSAAARPPRLPAAEGEETAHYRREGDVPADEESGVTWPEAAGLLSAAAVAAAGPWEYKPEHPDLQF